MLVIIDIAMVNYLKCLSLLPHPSVFLVEFTVVLTQTLLVQISFHGEKVIYLWMCLAICSFPV